MNFIKTYILLVSLIFSTSCSNLERDIVNIKKSKRIEYFYTNFYTNHNDQNIFELKFYNDSYFNVYNKGNLYIDSVLFNKIYNQLSVLNFNKKNKINFTGTFCQLVLINQDSIERLLVFNDDNYFSDDGVKFVKNDSLAYQLRKSLNIYNDYPVIRRSAFFKESKFFNLDTIPDDSNRNDEISSYSDFIGQIIPKY